MTKCIICFTEHSALYEDKPSMYCEPCATIKKDSVPVISHIEGKLYLSGAEAAKQFQGSRLYVHEDPNGYKGPWQQLHVPILTKKPNSNLDRSGAIASIDALNYAAEIIDMYVNWNDSLLVHCHGGVERSPLTLAWYFVTKAKKFDTLQEAYDFLKSKRPVVSERLFWLPY